MEALAVGCNYGFWDINTETDLRPAASAYRRFGYNVQSLFTPDLQQLTNALAGIPSDRDILFFSGHGNSHGMKFIRDQSPFYIRLTAGSMRGPTLLLANHLDNRTDCVIYAGCRTARGNASIAERSHTVCGVKHAIGWKESVGAHSHTRWLQKFHRAFTGCRDWESAIEQANIGCCFCWFTGVKSVRLFCTQNVTAQAPAGRPLLKKREKENPIWAARGESVYVAPKQPQPVLDFLAKLVENFSENSWQVIFTSQGNDDYCADVVLMKGDVYTSSSFTVFIRNNCLDSVYDARLEIPANADLKNGISGEQADRRLADIALTLENRRMQVLHQMWYRFFDAEKKEPSVVLLTQYQFSDADNLPENAAAQTYTCLLEEKML